MSGLPDLLTETIISNNLFAIGFIVAVGVVSGMVTPPVGLNVSVIKGAVGDTVKLHEIFKGVSWFILMDIVTLAILIAFPIITLYLPNLAQ